MLLKSTAVLRLHSQLGDCMVSGSGACFAQGHHVQDIAVFAVRLTSNSDISLSEAAMLLRFLF